MKNLKNPSSEQLLIESEVYRDELKRLGTPAALAQAKHINNLRSAAKLTGMWHPVEFQLAVSEAKVLLA